MAAGKSYQLLLNQAVQIQIAGRPDYICGIITNFLTDQIVVRFPQQAQLPDGLTAGLPIDLRCADAAGLRVGKSQIVELCAPTRPGIVVKMPPTYETVQNRRFFRVAVDFPCTIQLFEPSGQPMPFGKDEKARVLDISAGGARVSTSCPLGIGDQLMLDFVPQVDACKSPEPGSGAKDVGPSRPSNGRTPVRGINTQLSANPSPANPLNAPSIQLVAKVVRVVPPRPDAPDILQAGVELIQLTSRAQDRLVTLIFDVQRIQCHRS
jgi:hypothetical protein